MLRAGCCESTVIRRRRSVSTRCWHMRRRARLSSGLQARWHDAQRARWSPLQATKVRQALERDIYPAFGDLPLIDVDGPTVLKMLHKVEGRGAIDTAKRIRQHVSAVFGYGMAEGLCPSDPAATIGRALKPNPRGGKQPAVKDVKAARELLVTMEASTSGPLTKLASRLLALTVVRPGVVRAATWAEFEGIDWDDTGAPVPHALWRISAERMKLEQEEKGDEAFDHVVPLPRRRRRCCARSGG